MRAILVSRLMVLANVWVRRFCHQMPSGQCWILIDSTALHGANYFGLALSRALAKWAKAIERSLSASATVGPCLEFNSSPAVEIDEDRRIHAETDQPRSPKEICLSPTRYAEPRRDGRPHSPPRRCPSRKLLYCQRALRSNRRGIRSTSLIPRE